MDGDVQIFLSSVPGCVGGDDGESVLTPRDRHRARKLCPVPAQDLALSLAALDMHGPYARRGAGFADDNNVRWDDVDLDFSPVGGGGDAEGDRAVFRGETRI